MKKVWVLLCLFSLLSYGCASSILEYSGLNLKDVDMRADKLCRVTPCANAYFRAALGSDINRLPTEAVSTLSEIVAITDLAKRENRKLTQEESCSISGKWDRLIYLLGKPFILDIIQILK